MFQENEDDLNPGTAEWNLSVRCHTGSHGVTRHAVSRFLSRGLLASHEALCRRWLARKCVFRINMKVAVTPSLLSIKSFPNRLQVDLDGHEA